MRFSVARPRQLLAFAQLLLFVFSSSTSLLPCAHGSATNGSITSRAHHAPSPTTVTHQHGASHDLSLSVVSSDRTPVKSSIPPADTDCPWVVGCAGLVRVDVESPWRTIESPMPDVAPVGLTLRQVAADRDVESPPPRV
ncbi:MAG: hypothetical protein ABMA00_03690 [Gemmatimonas sp.]